MKTLKLKANKKFKRKDKKKENIQNFLIKNNIKYTNLNYKTCKVFKVSLNQSQIKAKYHMNSNLCVMINMTQFTFVD